MFIASAFLGDRGRLLVLGLSAENVRRLQAEQPIRVSRETHGMAVPPDLQIVIFTGDTEQTMREQMGALIGPSTVIDQKKPL